ncbi:MAG: glycosyltransferase family 4 protein [Oscillospiraceae bacterium]|nr:glycosyltransferase family 4 protein [Oscillospiraceae bacterium]
MLKKRICLIGQFPPPIHGLSKALDTLYKSEFLNQNYDFVKIDITNNRRFITNYRLISRTHADLFYLTISQSIGGNFRDLLIMNLLKKQGKKCLVHLHGGYFRKLYDEEMTGFQRKLNDHALKSIAGAIVLGDSLKYIFRGLVEEDKVFVIPNCVDDEYLLSEEELEAKLENQSNIYHILYLSNFIKSKGYDVALGMAKGFKDIPGTRRFHFDFAGRFYEDEERSVFEDYVKDNSLDDMVTYHGIVSGDAKRNLLKNSSFFILPTEYPREGQPISILEAMGNGLVVLTTKHAGIPDVVSDGINGCVVDCDKDKVRIYIDYLNSLSNEQIAEISKNNYKKIKEHYLENTYISNLDRCFSLLIKGE